MRVTAPKGPHPAHTAIIHHDEDRSGLAANMAAPAATPSNPMISEKSPHSRCLRSANLCWISDTTTSPLDAVGLFITLAAIATSREPVA